MRTTVISLAVSLAVAFAAPAWAGPTYWDFNGSVTINAGVPDVAVGDTLIGRFWGDPDTDELWELRWWTNASGSLASPLYLQADFSGYTILSVDPDYIAAVNMSPVDSIVFDPLPGGNYYSHTLALATGGTSFLKANPLQFVTSDAPAPQPVIPAPGALLLSGLGIGGVGWLRRRRAL